MIGTNKSDAAETVRCLLEDLAVGPGAGAAPLPRPAFSYPDPVDQLVAPAVGADDVVAGDWPLATVLAGRGIRPVSYAEWLRIEAAETDLAAALGRASGSSCTIVRRSGRPAAPQVTS